MTCLEKLTKSHSSMQDTSKRSKGEHKLSVEITRFEIFYHIFYHPNCLITTFQEVLFALREKKVNGRVINLKGNPKFSRYCPKS